MRAACLASVLCAACAFSGPGDGVGPGGGQGADAGGGGGDAPRPCDDDDQDGVCNTLDDWPCGAKPDDPGDEMGRDDVLGGRWWGARNIAIGNARRVVARPNEEFDIAFTWSLTIVCGLFPAQCDGQIEIGHDGSRTGCLFDDNVTSTVTRNGDAATTYRAPATPGVYEIRLNAGRRQSCGTNGWYGENPGGDATIAILCVRP